MDINDMPYVDFSRTSPLPTPIIVDTASSNVMLVSNVVSLAIPITFAIGLWRVFEKAGQSGWKVLIPIYNLYILLKILGRSGWWLLLFIVPFINIVFSIVVSFELGRAFGKGKLFSLFLLVILSPVGCLILGFSEAKYLGPKGGQVVGEGLQGSTLPVEPAAPTRS